jgi:hypothetical protein
MPSCPERPVSFQRDFGRSKTDKEEITYEAGNFSLAHRDKLVYRSIAQLLAGERVN